MLLLVDATHRLAESGKVKLVPQVEVNESESECRGDVQC